MTWMDRDSFVTLLNEHKRWLQNEEEGKRLMLMDVDLHGFGLRGCDLSKAVFRNCDLSCCDLRRAVLRGACFDGCKMHWVCFNLSDLCNCRFQDCELCGSYMEHCLTLGLSIKGGDLRGWKFERSPWELGSSMIEANVDDYFVMALLRQAVGMAEHSPFVSDAVKRMVLTTDITDEVEKFYKIEHTWLDGVL